MMPRHILLGSLTAILLLPTLVRAQEAGEAGIGPIADGINMKLVVHKEPPFYPYSARKDHLEGRGVLVGQVDFKTGIVTSVRMERSTGYKILDDASLRAFQQWRFKPGTVRKFRTPITYVMRN